MPSFSRRTALKGAGIAATVGLTGLAGCTGNGDDTNGDGPYHLPLGHGLAAEEPLWLMDAMPELLEYDGEVYDLDLIPFDGNTQRFQAFQAGELEAGTGTAISLIFATESGLPMTITGGVAQETADDYSTSFIARPDSDITGINEESLDGKTIGICDFRASCHMWADGAARQAGLETEVDVELAQIPFPSMAGAVEEGQVDMATAAMPFDFVAQAEYDHEIMWTGVDAIGFDHDLIELWFSTFLIEERPDVVEAFMADYATANEYFNENTEEAKEAILDAEFVQTPPEQYLDMPTWGHSVEPLTESLDQLNQLSVELGWTDDEADLDLLYDLSFLP